MDWKGMLFKGSLMSDHHGVQFPCAAADAVDANDVSYLLARGTNFFPFSL